MPINPANQDSKIYEALYLGFRVDKAAANLPQVVGTDYFTISGGRVLVTLILGEVTTLIQTLANATKLVYNPTDAGADQDLCATLDITADAVGTIYHISGTVADALRDNLNFGRGTLFAAPLILKPGTLALNCAGSATGATKWSLWYIPLEDGASVAVS